MIIPVVIILRDEELERGIRVGAGRDGSHGNLLTISTVRGLSRSTLYNHILGAQCEIAAARYIKAKLYNDGIPVSKGYDPGWDLIAEEGGARTQVVGTEFHSPEERIMVFQGKKIAGEWIMSVRRATTHEFRLNAYTEISAWELWRYGGEIDFAKDGSPLTKVWWMDFDRMKSMENWWGEPLNKRREP